MTALKNSPADGSVLVMTPLVTIVTAPHIQKLPYDPFKDFEPVAIHRRDYNLWGPVIKASGFKPGS